MPPDRRQRPIAVTSKQRSFLEEQKAKFDANTNTNTDWGQFLGGVVLLGLAAIGIYALANAVNRTSQSVDVTCLECQGTFVMALSNHVEPVVYTRCPHCNRELVVNLANINRERR